MQIKPLHEFSISIKKEVEKQEIKIQDGKTITETFKAVESVSVPFCLKKLSRFEKDEADIYRSVWETRYIDAGVAPQVILLKKYSNYGGILSDEQKDYYAKLQRDFLLAETELRRLQVNDADNKDAIESKALDMVTLRQAILDFQQEQSVFFSNTAESKARQKLIEWLVFYLTYYRPLNDKGEPGEWTPFFKGDDIEAKMDDYEAKIEANDEMWLKAADLTTLLATAYANGGEREVPEVAALHGEENTTQKE